MNLYLEMIESGQGKSAAVLYSTPGLARRYTLSSVGCRGIWTAQGRTFCISGTTLWELLSPTANPNKINRGSVVSDGEPVSFASGPTQVLIASSQILYVYDLTANTLSAVPNFDAGTGLGLLGPVAQVVYVDGFFFVRIGNSNQIQQSNALDGATWQGVAETQVSVFADNVVSIFADHRLLWVSGPNATQPYFDAGDFPFAYDVIQGAFIEQGTAAPFSWARLDNSVFWLGQDSRGAGIVWRANGYTPQRVSTHAIEYEFSTYTKITDAVCYAYQDQGHTFYVMNFPTAQKTWVYDCATQAWHQRGYWNGQAGVYTQSRAGFHTYNFGMHLVADPTTGVVYEQSISIYSDDGNPKRWLRRCPHISTEQAWHYYNRLQLDLETGLPFPPFQGSAVPTRILMTDAGGHLRALSIAEGGIIQAPSAASGTAQLLYLNDRTNTSTWQITIDGAGIVGATQVTYDPTGSAAMQCVSILGDTLWILSVEDLGGGIAILRTDPIGIVGRGPLVMMRFSRDGGQTWSNEYTRDCGQAGKFLTRVLWNRLGRARDFVVEFSGSDAVPWRLIDAYIFMDGDFSASERVASEYRRRA